MKDNNNFKNYWRSTGRSSGLPCHISLFIRVELSLKLRPEEDTTLDIGYDDQQSECPDIPF